ncbi:POTRA domain-containing protein, partial [Bacteroidota bacterium]
MDFSVFLFFNGINEFNFIFAEHDSFNVPLELWNVNINKALKIFTLLHKSNCQRIGFVIILIAIYFSSCSPVKYVTDDQYLLDRYRVKIKEGKVKKEEVKKYVRQKPNKRILGIRFHLWLYNLSRKDKDKGLSNWFKTIGEEPVIYDEYLADKSVDLLKSFLDNKGYYNSVVKDTVLLKRKRARILYKIEVNEPYTIRSIQYTCNDTSLAPQVLPDTINSLINIGDNFDLDLLQDERQRIESNLKNKGYYNFNKEFIHFQADSIAKTNKVDLVLNIGDFQKRGPDNTIIKNSHKKYTINKVYVFTNFDQKEALSQGDGY